MLTFRKKSDINALSHFELGKGYWLAATHDNGSSITVRFKDKTDIFVLTNCFTADPIKKNYRMIPQVINFYNKYMNCVDRFDCSFNSNKNKVRGWKKALIIYIFRMIVTNAWRYHECQNKHFSLKEFLKSIICKFALDHKINMAPNHTIQKQQNQGVFIVCSHTIYKNRSKSSYMCVECGKYMHHFCYFKAHGDHLNEQLRQKRQKRQKKNI